MDEGFTTYAESRITNHLHGDDDFPFEGTYNSYFRLVKSGMEEPMSTHADHYNTNYAYSVASYPKAAFLWRSWVILWVNKTWIKSYWLITNQWRFKHPNPNDFIRVAEKVSGMELQWYKEYWVYTTKTIDYALGDINT